MFNKVMKALISTLQDENAVHMAEIENLRSEIRAYAGENTTLRNAISMIESRVEGLHFADIERMLGKRWIEQESGDNPREVDELRRAYNQQKQEMRAVAAENAALRKVVVPHAAQELFRGEVAEREHPIARRQAHGVIYSPASSGTLHEMGCKIKALAASAEMLAKQLQSMASNPLDTTSSGS